MQKKYANTKACIIGNGTHSKRIQNILKKKKINFLIKKSYKKSLNYSEISHAKNLKKLFEIYEKR